MGEKINYDILRRRYWKIEHEHGVRELTLILSNVEKKILRILADGLPKTRYELSFKIHKIPYQQVHPTISRLLRMNLLIEHKGYKRGKIRVPSYSLSLFGLLVVIYDIYFESLAKWPQFNETKKYFMEKGIKPSRRLIFREIMKKRDSYLILDEFVNKIKKVLFNNKELLPNILHYWDIFTDEGILIVHEALRVLLEQIDKICLSSIWEPDHPSRFPENEEHIRAEIECGFFRAFVEGPLDWKFLPEKILHPEFMKHSILGSIFSDHDLSRMYLRVLEDMRSDLESKLCLLQHLEKLAEREISRLHGDKAFLLMKVIAMGDRGKYGRALDFYDKMLAENPENALVWINKGIALLNIGGGDPRYYFEENWEIWDQDLSKGESLGEDWRDMPESNRKEMLLQALECLDKALLLNGQKKLEPLILRVKGKTLCALEKYEDALECLDNSLKADPESEDVIKMKLDILCRCKRYEEATRCLSSLLEKSSACWRDWITMGELLALCGNYKESIEAFEKALTLAYDRQDYILYYEAQIHARFKNFHAAIESLNKIEEPLRSLFSRGLIMETAKKDEVILRNDKISVKIIED